MRVHPPPTTGFVPARALVWWIVLTLLLLAVGVTLDLGRIVGSSASRACLAGSALFFDRFDSWIGAFAALGFYLLMNGIIYYFAILCVLTKRSAGARVLSIFPALVVWILTGRFHHWITTGG